MSQEKVDRHKYEKANRQKIMRREKIQRILRRTVLALVGVALVAWLGYSAYDTYESNKERETFAVNYDAVSDYVNGLTEED